MIKIKHLTRETTIVLQRYLDRWRLDVNTEYDELANLYDVEINSNVPIFIKHWSGVGDNNIYLHIGSKILAIEGEVEIS